MTLAAAADNLRRWRENPPVFVREVSGATPDPWQDDVLAAFPSRQRLAMKACKGPGKTAVEGLARLELSPHPPAPEGRRDLDHEGQSGRQPLDRDGEVAGTLGNPQGDLRVDEDADLRPREARDLV